MEKQDWNCKECDIYFLWGYEKAPTKREIKILGLQKGEPIIAVPKTKIQWEQAELRIAKCEHYSMTYNEIKENKSFNQCGVKIKLCQKCKNKIKKLKKTGLVK